MMIKGVRKIPILVGYRVIVSKSANNAYHEGRNIYNAQHEGRGRQSNERMWTNEGRGRQPNDRMWTNEGRGRQPNDRMWTNEERGRQPNDRTWTNDGRGRQPNQRMWTNVSGYGGRQRSFNTRQNMYAPGAGSQLQPVDWTRIDLKEMKKDVYVENPSAANRNTIEIDEWMSEHEILLKGNEIPKPILSFAEATFPGPIGRILQDNYTTPTPIQSITWPTALKGRDLISISKTGSGKTLAFILPAIVHTLAQAKRSTPESPGVLVLLPTRELARQVEEVAIPYCSKVNLRTACLYGGQTKQIQYSTILQGVDICIATPGRLLDFLGMQALNLKRCSYVVYDEADRMLDMGFEPQIRQIGAQIRPDHQSLMFTATWPREIQSLANDFLKNPIYLQTGQSELTVNRNITQIVEVVQEDDKPQRLCELLNEFKQKPGFKTLIFVATKLRADILARKLAQRGYNTNALHGDKTQSQRDAIMHEFRRDPDSIMIATDVAARGIDVNDIKYVINYDYPQNCTDYVHRIGRTGRCEKLGTALTFFAPEQRFLATDLIKVLESANQNIPTDLENLVSTKSQSAQFR